MQTPRTKSLRAIITDKLLLIGVALVFIVVLLTVFVLGDKYHVPTTSLFGGLFSISFIFVIGRGLREKFAKPLFVFYFAAWVVVHSTMMGAAMHYFGLPGAIAAVLPDLALFYAVTFRLFGIPQNKPDPITFTPNSGTS